MQTRLQNVVEIEKYYVVMLSFLLPAIFSAEKRDKFAKVLTTLLASNDHRFCTGAFW